jgi:polysaccharide pyruvyl transferase WcaK-like protein/sulfatase maturation enzyme AslB (radical SAM superfamily)
MILEPPAIPLDFDPAERPAARIAIFGAGSGGSRAWDALTASKRVEVVAFLDNDERHRDVPLHGLPVLSPAALSPADVDAVVVGSMHLDTITDQLLGLGYPGARIHTVASLTGLPDRAIQRTASVTGLRPTTLNFQVNDICNARCVMCNIWQNKRDKEMSPAEFAAMLADPYFAELEYAGITGGEPTLRRDLPDFYTVLADSCPKLKLASFITHGLDTERAVTAYRQVADAYRLRGIGFLGMVSIDGVGALHDTVRGREHAFERATRTLFELNAAGVPTTACCTAVRSNVWGLRDLLAWSRGKTYVRFRVAEFINRLGNDGRTDEIRSFDDAERSELISFFQHLIDSFEPDEMVRRTYASIITLLGGGERMVGCPYQSGEALSVDCRGNFAVCAPKGTPHPLTSSPAAAVAGAEPERQGIIARHCSSCIHDCHSEWRPDVAQTLAVAATVQHRLAAVPSPAVTVDRAGDRSASTMRQVLVLGWYGTETVGDLAILAGIVGEYRHDHPGVRFVVPSHYPAYTRHNLARMALDCDVTSYGDPELIGDLWNCDTVIIGGGPLMDIPQIAWLASIFERARRRGCRTIVEGCGVGPVNRPETAAAILRIVEASDEIRLRDAGSARQLEALGAGRTVDIVEDPAVRWVRSTGIRHTTTVEGPISVFARELTAEYPQATSIEGATTAVAAFLRRVCDWHPGRAVRLHAMHHFPVGGDDREFARRLAGLIDRPACTVDEIPRTPLETVGIMAEASLVICMRFHSLVFAHTIGAPLLAIDYTDGGKVAHYIDERGLHHRLVALTDLANLTRDNLPALGLPVPVAVGEPLLQPGVQ